jgi:hypothetical protein
MRRGAGIARPHRKALPAKPGGDGGEVRQEVSGSFFEKKEPKKLLLILGRSWGRGYSHRTKVFCCFFSKKQRFLPPSLEVT